MAFTKARQVTKSTDMSKPSDAMGETRIRVRYAETDQMGVAYYANFFVWFEIGRVELLRHLGFDYKSMEVEEDCFIPVVEATCRYKAPARYDEELIVQTEASSPRAYLVKFRYRVLRAGDRQLLAEGETTHVITDRGMKKKDLPERVLVAINGI